MKNLINFLKTKKLPKSTQSLIINHTKPIQSFVGQRTIQTTLYDTQGHDHKKWGEVKGLSLSLDRNMLYPEQLPLTKITEETATER